MSVILNAFVRKLTERLMGFVGEKAAMVLGVKGELERLLRKLGRIQNVLEDAERRSLEESAINDWVNELKDVMYDADDIIDLCMCAQLLPEEQQPSSSSSQNSYSPLVSCGSSFFSCFKSAPRRYEIAEKIKSLNDRLEEISKDRLQFNLNQGQPKTRVTEVNSRQTSPVLAELDVVGSEIEDATKELVKLMTEGEVMRKKCSVFAITGMGGIGKTTLAQKIFNHQKVQAMFQIKVWICISQNYNEIELLKQIIRDANGSYGGEANSKAELQPRLKSAVHGKSLFLVLDDVWRADVWIDLLRSPLQSAQIDASILITSRDDNVAKQMGSVHIHHVMHLPVETGWEMLVRRLIMIREEEILNLREVGIQIIEKCSGLPLVIKVMAGVLARKVPVASEWKKVLENDAWSMRKLPEELRGALYLSYDDLPSSLKQCFLYCSLFPEYRKINQNDLIKLWVAEGFIEEEGDLLMEDKAEEYFQELTQRNLLQLDPLSYGGLEYKMHDLLRSLAQFISKDESFSENSAYKSTIPLTKLRRISIISHNDARIPDTIAEPRSLRTLLVFNFTSALEYNQMGRFRHLRVLDLTRNIRIKTIPSAIGDLFHLRYLNLKATLIRHLPESIGNLSNLQFLNLDRNHLLKKLPQSITRLKNLRCLTIADKSLDFMPKDIERLQKLNDLKGFVVGKGKKEIMHSTLEALSSLSNLRILYLYNLERARPPGSFVLQELSKLKNLKLKWSPQTFWDGQENDISLIQELFEELVPPQSLEELCIDYYFGYDYPKWVMSLSLGSYLPYLSILTLSNNSSCPLLPPFGLLPHLRVLKMLGADAVKRIGPEFLGDGVISSKSQARIAFPMLQKLEFCLMRNLEEWCFFDEKEENDVLQKLTLLPCLDELRLEYCPKLRALPCGLERITLKRLIINLTRSLKEVGNLPYLVECLDLRENLSLERISNLPALKCLIVDDCPALKFVERLDGLQQLKLIDHFMKCLPEWLSKFTKERQKGREDTNAEDDFVLHLGCRRRVLQRCLQGGGDWPVIQQIQRVNAYIDNGNQIEIYERNKSVKGYMRFVKQPFSYETNIGDEESEGEKESGGEEESEAKEEPEGKEESDGLLTTYYWRVPGVNIGWSQ